VISGNMFLQKLRRVNIARISILLGNAVFAHFTKGEIHGTSASSA
jgi:hypothetical protein